METCSRNLNLQQLSYDYVSGCSLDLKRNEHGKVHLPVSGLNEVICPMPRAPGAPCIINRVSSSFSERKRDTPFLRCNANDLLKSLLGKDLLEDEPDVTGSPVGLLSCSPPVRVNNPVVHDVQFIQTSILQLPSGVAQIMKDPSPSEKGLQSTGSPHAEKPIIRIEGFICGGSKSYIPASA